ncbi:MAG: 23S rRNA (uracil1939-C5)-methyltransferase, partial [Candidatus Azotimanducaceae bacterium]
KVLEQVLMDSAGAKGKAVGRAEDGRVVFVANAVPGDVCDIRTTKQRTKYYEGVAVNFHKLSERRTEPVCEYFGECGGCKWQHMAYDSQLEFKQNEVVNNLKRLGGLELPDSQPILGSKEQYFYRNKMEFSFSDKRWMRQSEVDSGAEITNRNGLGFHIPGAWDKILDVEKCHLQEDPSNAIRNEVRAFANANNLEFFNPRHKTGLLRTMMLRLTSTGEIMVLIQFFKEEKENRELLLDHLKATFPEITSLQYVINGKDNDTIYDQEVICYAGEPHIFEEMEGLKFRIGPKSFYQTNSKQAYELYKLTREFAMLSGNELVYDLYTGTGTIAQFIAKNAKKVIGIESVPDAITDAKINATVNGIDNVEFFAGDMKKVLNDAFIAEHGMPDVIITDPPRDGMHADVVATILRIAPKHIVYVSCNSATQARDVALMTQQYKVTKVQPVDMFPQTHHVENILLLEKRS